MITFTEKIIMEKFEKVTMAVKILPKTKVKFELIRKKTGLSYGQLIDKLIEEYNNGQDEKVI
jgi:hypothetical protein